MLVGTGRGGYFVLSPEKRKRWRPVGLNERHQLSHRNIGDCEQFTRTGELSRRQNKPWSKLASVRSCSSYGHGVVPVSFMASRFLAPSFIKYLRQYAHSHWSIGVFR